MIGVDKIENTLWVEKWRPNTIDGYVGNENLIEKVKIYIANGDVPHLLLYGAAGGGKTTLAKIITSNFDADVMYINASDENNVETVRAKIKNFASSMGFRRWKLVILDECDYLTPNAQAALRNLMETFSKTTRFILTCNYVEKVIDPIQSRCQTFNIVPPNKTDVAKRIIHILNEEGVEYSNEDVATIVNNGYPDLRRVINSCQRQVINGKLTVDKQSLVEANYMYKILDILKTVDSKKDCFNQVRQLLADSKVKDYTHLYRFLYDEVDQFATGHIGPVILLIGEGAYIDVSVVDKEINVMTMFIKIINEIKG